MKNSQSKEQEKKAYFEKLRSLYEQGRATGEILPFEDEFWKELDGKICHGTPAAIELKYLRPTNPPGRCWDRSYAISMGLPGCDLVKGDVKYLEYSSGSKEDSLHFWVEKDGWCYEPWKLLKFKQTLFYEMFEPTNVGKQPRAELEKDKYYREGLKGCFDYHSLIVTIPLLEGIAQKRNDLEFIEDVERFKARTNYDLKTITKELDDAMADK